MWNIRMRASKKYRRQKPRVRSQESDVRSRKTATTGLHISGAEGIYEASDITKITESYIKRALIHSRGTPDKIVITIEELEQRPRHIPLLPVHTVQCPTPDQARGIIMRSLTDLGISQKALIAGFRVLSAERTMRGAALVHATSGSRLEPDRARGIRVSRFGIEKSALRRLSRRLSRDGINTTAVREALLLASKVASHPAVIAEVCISDDPDYTTGYVASRSIGYTRIPNIKKRGDMRGGRVFFVTRKTGINALVAYLERAPVLLY